MKISAIDIGSNSVRLATFADGKTLYKLIETTRLGEGLVFTGVMKEEAIERSAQAVARFYARAKSEGASRVYAFATAAVRSASNDALFVKRVFELCSLKVEVISGETEAEIALLGALGKSDGGIIDLGGASTEITVRRSGKRIFSKSVDIGAVRLYDVAGRDRDKLEKFISEKISEYGPFTAENYNMYGVSGTATTLAALKCGLKEYDGNVVQGTQLTVSETEQYAEYLLNLSVEEICGLLTVDTRRADIIGGGALLLARIMQKIKIKSITVSDRDNLEGFAILKEGTL